MNLAQKKDGMEERGFFKLRKKGFSAQVSRSRKASNRTRLAASKLLTEGELSNAFPLEKDPAADLRL
jgi:hypothetical protein